MDAVKSTPTTALEAVHTLMADHAWRPLHQIHDELWRCWRLAASETTCSARIRQLRRMGCHIERRPMRGRRPGCRACDYRLAP